jgi:translation initiation factor IF-3
MGILWLREAQDAARDAGLDLIEVAPEASPPVCRIMDWGRYRYEQKMREREQRKKQRSTDMKGLRLRPSTDDHDFNVARRKAEMFLTHGHKVRIEVRFRGREITHQELGVAQLDKFAAALADISEVEQRPTMENRRMAIVIAPRPEAILAKDKQDAKAMAALEAELDAELDDDDDDDVTLEGEATPESEAADDTTAEAPAESPAAVAEPEVELSAESDAPADSPVATAEPEPEPSAESAPDEPA